MLDETTPAPNWEELTPEQRDRALDGGDPMADESAEQEAPAPELEEGAPGEEAPEATQPAANPEDSPNFKNLRGKVQQMQNLLNDPAALAQHVARLGYQLTPQQQQAVNNAAQGAADPFAAFEPEIADALKGVITSIIEPLQQKLEQYEAHAKTSEERAAIAELEQEIPGFGAMVQRFDERLPHEAHRFGPMDKFLITQGARIVDPSERQALVTELLDALTPEEQDAILAPRVKASAAQTLAQQIKPGAGKPKPVTLSGAAPAKDNDILPEVGNLNTDQYRRLPADQRNKLLG